MAHSVCWTLPRNIGRMTRLTLFGLVAVTAMLVCFALERTVPTSLGRFAQPTAFGDGVLAGVWPGLPKDAFGDVC
jgi:hypothetical protein